MPAKPKPSAKPAKGKTVATLRDDAKRKNLPTVEYQSHMREAGGWIAPGCAVLWVPPAMGRRVCGVQGPASDYARFTRYRWTESVTCTGS